jgi:hypothetical protein
MKPQKQDALQCVACMSQQAHHSVQCCCISELWAGAFALLSLFCFCQGLCPRPFQVRWKHFISLCKHHCAPWMASLQLMVYTQCSLLHNKETCTLCHAAL